MLNLNEVQKNDIIEYLTNRKLLSDLYNMPETKETDNLINNLESIQLKKLKSIDPDLATEIIINGDDLINKITK